MEDLVRAELAVLQPSSYVVEDRAGLLLAIDPELEPRVAVGGPLGLVFARAEFTVWDEVREVRTDRAIRALSERIAASLEPSGEPPALHVWSQGAGRRDERVAEARALERRLRIELGGRVRSKIAAGIGEEVVDVVCSGRGAYVLGAHQRAPQMSAFPGGIRRLKARADAPSRAHLKLEEGLEWAELELEPGEVAVDVGCAPGGFSFVLLERGLRVVGVDPVPVAPSLLGEPRFRHHAGPVSTFRPEVPGDVQWLFCDMNGPPLAAIAQVVGLMRRLPRLAAVFHTVKLSDDPPLEVLGEVRAGLRDAGFSDQRARHLYHNRSELTLVARPGPRPP